MKSGMIGRMLRGVGGGQGQLRGKIQPREFSHKNAATRIQPQMPAMGRGKRFLSGSIDSVRSEAMNF